MKKIRECKSIEEMFQYENVGEKMEHEEIMIKNGYVVMPVPTFMKNSLMVGYGKTECKYID